MQQLNDRVFTETTVRAEAGTRFLRLPFAGVAASRPPWSAR
jgi:hypothetical protein